MAQIQSGDIDVTPEDKRVISRARSIKVKISKSFSRSININGLVHFITNFITNQISENSFNLKVMDHKLWFSKHSYLYLYHHFISRQWSFFDQKDLSHNDYQNYFKDPTPAASRNNMRSALSKDININ